MLEFKIFLIFLEMYIVKSIVHEMSLQMFGNHEGGNYVRAGNEENTNNGMRGWAGIVRQWCR